MNLQLVDQKYMFDKTERFGQLQVRLWLKVWNIWKKICIWQTVLLNGLTERILSYENPFDKLRT